MILHPKRNPGAVITVGQCCIVGILTASHVDPARRGRNDTVCAVHRRVAVSARHRPIGTLFRPQGLSGRCCGVGFGHDARSKREQIKAASTDAAD